jgi:hypothetical protein
MGYLCWITVATVSKDSDENERRASYLRRVLTCVYTASYVHIVAKVRMLLSQPPSNSTHVHFTTLSKPFESCDKYALGTLLVISTWRAQDQLNIRGNRRGAAALVYCA